MVAHPKMDHFYALKLCQILTSFQTFSLCVVYQQGGHIEYFMQKLQDVTVNLDNN